MENSNNVPSDAHLSELLEQGCLTIGALESYTTRGYLHRLIRCLQQLSLDNYTRYLLFLNQQSRNDHRSSFMEIIRATLAATPLDGAYYTILAQHFSSEFICERLFVSYHGLKGVKFLLSHAQLFKNNLTSALILGLLNAQLYNKKDLSEADDFFAGYLSRQTFFDLKPHIKDLLFIASLQNFEKTTVCLIKEIPELASRQHVLQNKPLLLPMLRENINDYLIKNGRYPSFALNSNDIKKICAKNDLKNNLEKLQIQLLSHTADTRDFEHLSDYLFFALAYNLPQLAMNVFNIFKKLELSASERFFEHWFFHHDYDYQNNYKLLTHRTFKTLWPLLMDLRDPRPDYPQHFMHRSLSTFKSSLGINAKLYNAALRHHSTIYGFLTESLLSGQSLQLFFYDSRRVSWGHPWAFPHRATTATASYKVFTAFPELFSAASLIALKKVLGSNTNLADYLIATAVSHEKALLEKTVAYSKHSYDNKIFHMNLTVLSDLFLSKEQLRSIATASDAESACFIKAYHAGLWAWGIHQLLMRSHPMFYLASAALEDTLADEQALNFIWNISNEPILENLAHKYERVGLKIEQIHTATMRRRSCQKATATPPLLLSQGITTRTQAAASGSCDLRLK